MVIYDRNTEMLSILLERGAVIDTPNVYGETPLLCALILHYEPAIVLLLSRGADPNVRNRAHKCGLQLLLNEYERIKNIDLIRGVREWENSFPSPFKETIDAIKRCIALLIEDPRIALTKDELSKYT